MTLRWGWLVVALSLCSGTVLARCPTPAGQVERSDAERLKFLKTELVAEGNRAWNWSIAWATIYAAGTVGQVAPIPLIVPSDQVEWWVGAATTAVGIAFVAFDPLEVIDAAPRFEKRTTQPADICAVIAEGEGLLERGAAHEALGRRWFIHALNVVFNVGVGLILGLGYGHWVAGAVNFAIGVTLGEATILTSPNRLVSAWSEYQRGELGQAATPVSFKVFPMIRSDAAGLGVALTF